MADVFDPVMTIVVMSIPALFVIMGLKILTDPSNERALSSKTVKRVRVIAGIAAVIAIGINLYFLVFTEALT